MHSSSKTNGLEASKIPFSKSAESYQLQDTRYLLVDQDIDREGHEDEGSPHDQPLASSRGPQRTTVLLVIFAGLSLAFAVVMWHKMQNQEERGTVKTLFPPTEWETRIFHAGHIAPGPATDQIWEDQLTHGRGFVIVDDPASLGLPRGQRYVDGHSKYGVTWAHQYHCLWMLNREFWRFVNNESALVGVDYRGTSEEASLLWHLAHCYDYMREHVVCAMDMSLEWPTMEGSNTGTISGYEVPRTCKKREAIDKYMDEHGPNPDLEMDPKTGLPKAPEHDNEHGHGNS